MHCSLSNDAVAVYTRVQNVALICDVSAEQMFCHLEMMKYTTSYRLDAGNLPPGCLRRCFSCRQLSIERLTERCVDLIRTIGLVDQQIVSWIVRVADGFCDDDRSSRQRSSLLETDRRRLLSAAQDVAVSSRELGARQAVDHPVDARRQPQKHDADEVDFVR